MFFRGLAESAKIVLALIWHFMTDNKFSSPYWIAILIFAKAIVLQMLFKEVKFIIDQMFIDDKRIGVLMEA